jgi:hypothetical protein
MKTSLLLSRLNHAAKMLSRIIITESLTYAKPKIASINRCMITTIFTVKAMTNFAIEMIENMPQDT